MKRIRHTDKIRRDDKLREQAFVRHRFEKDMAQLRADAEGIKAEGLIKDREEGIKVGRELEKIAIIRNLIAAGMNDEFILDCADCSVKLLEKVKNSMK